MAADIISGFAALATLVAVFYARATVQESRKGRQEASLAHVEEMTRLVDLAGPLMSFVVLLIASAHGPPVRGR